jgi:hypothetical protein
MWVWMAVGITMVGYVITLSILDWIFVKSVYIWFPYGGTTNSTLIFTSPAFCTAFPIYCGIPPSQLVDAISYSTSWFIINMDWLRIPMVTIYLILYCLPTGYTLIFVAVAIPYLLYIFIKLLQLGFFALVFFNCPTYWYCYLNTPNQGVSTTFYYEMLFSSLDLGWLVAIILWEVPFCICAKEMRRATILAGFGTRFNAMYRRLPNGEEERKKTSSGKKLKKKTVVKKTRRKKNEDVKLNIEPIEYVPVIQKTVI